MSSRGVSKQKLTLFKILTLVMDFRYRWFRSLTIVALISVLCAGFLSCSLACDGPVRPDVRGMMAPLVDSRRSKLFVRTIIFSQ